MTESKLADLLRAKGRTEKEIEMASDEFDTLYRSAEESGESAWPDKFDELIALAQRWDFTLDELNYDESAPKADEFENAFNRLVSVMVPLGKNGYDDNSDYWIVDDNYSVRDLLVEVINLELNWVAIKKTIHANFCAALPAWAVIIRFSDHDDRIESSNGV